jgi:hypothetical protein
MWISYYTIILLLLGLFLSLAQGEITCPPYLEIPYCSCFVLDDQLHMQCSGSDIGAMKKSLQVLNGPVKSYSVYDLDARASILPNGVTDNVTSPVYHLQVGKKIRGICQCVQIFISTESHMCLLTLLEKKVRGEKKHPGIGDNIFPNASFLYLLKCVFR